MKVILTDDVYNLGDMGETVDVKPGYARNFLIPRKLAVIAESASAKQIKHELNAIKRREAKLRKELASVKDALDQVTVEITAHAGEEGKLFGSVTSAMIAEALLEMGHEVPRRKIVLGEPLKALGEYELPVKLGAGVEAQIKVVVKPEEVVEPEVAPGEELVSTVSTPLPEEPVEEPTEGEPEPSGQVSEESEEHKGE